MLKQSITKLVLGQMHTNLCGFQQYFNNTCIIYEQMALKEKTILYIWCCVSISYNISKKATMHFTFPKVKEVKDKEKR